MCAVCVFDQVSQSVINSGCTCWNEEMIRSFCVLSLADAVFLILYKELYYRHIYAKVSVSTC